MWCLKTGVIYIYIHVYILHVCIFVGFLGKLLYMPFSYVVSSLFSMLPNSGWRANESWPSASIRDALLKDGLGLNFCRYIGQMGGVGIYVTCIFVNHAVNHYG